MGLFDKLLGGGDTTVTVSLEPVEVSPGGDVFVRYDVGGALDEKDRGVRVSLVGTAAYRYEMSRKNAQDRVVTTEEWGSFEIHDEEQTFPAQLGPGQATFKVPQNAPPSSGG